jgi:hypothetical protein
VHERQQSVHRRRLSKWHVRTPRGQCRCRLSRRCRRVRRPRSLHRHLAELSVQRPESERLAVQRRQQRLHAGRMFDRNLQSPSRQQRHGLPGGCRRVRPGGSLHRPYDGLSCRLLPRQRRGLHGGHQPVHEGRLWVRCLHACGRQRRVRVPRGGRGVRRGRNLQRYQRDLSAERFPAQRHCLRGRRSRLHS